MFEGLFKRKSVGPEDVRLTPPEEKPQFKMEDFIVAENFGKVTIFIPNAMINAVGGRGVLINFFRESFDGSGPTWAENHADSDSFAIEIPNNPAKIEEFQRGVLAKISE